MLENKKKAGELNVALKKKIKKSKKAKASNKAKETKEEKEERKRLDKEYKKRVAEQDPEFKKKTWDFSFIKIASLIQNKEELQIESDNLMPFDFVATSDQEFDAQRDVVVERIQRLLVAKKPDDSIALFREARCLWPNEKDLFGTAALSADEEFETFKSLFMRPVEIKKPEAKKKQQQQSSKENEEEQMARDEAKSDEDDDEGLGEDNLDADMNEEFGDEADDEEYEKGGGYVVEEENLDFEKFLFRYTHPQILRCYILMLGEYTKNSDFVNRCCMSMFERIAYECHAPQCLYQLSLFHLINTLYKDPMSRCMMNIMDDRRHATNTATSQVYSSTYSSEDMFAFFRKLMAKFFEQSRLNSKLFLELLFFKDKKIVYELGEESNGYEPLEFKASGKKVVAWTPEQEEELKQLFEK
jgi:hypothetical protein